MAKIIRLKKGLKQNLPSEAPLGEPFVTIDTGELFVGQGEGKPLIQIKGYKVPEGGIPESDLEQIVQDALQKARDLDTEITNARGGYASLGERLDTFSTVNQVTKLDVVASDIDPKVVEITIPETTDFKVPPIMVLKFNPGAQDSVQTICGFDNSDSEDFQGDEYVEFDGTMHLKTSYSEAMTEDTSWAGTGKSWYKTIDISNFKEIEQIEVI